MEVAVSGWRARVVAVAWCLAASGTLRADARDAALALAELRDLTNPPATYPADGYADEQGARALFFENVLWRGEPTRVFARLGFPAATGTAKVPGVVLVHGGGGTAFAEWVRRWNEHGFAAIAIAVEGQTDVRDPAGPRGAAWKRQPWGGPARVGIYGDSGQPIRDQWIYHACAAAIRANSLLRAQAGVNPARVGVMGISWGGVITSTVIGLDRRLAFAIPTYGCGDLATADNQYGRALGTNTLYRDVWNPRLRLDAATMPVLWYSWPGDEHFPLDAQARSYRAAPGPRMVVLRPGMRHSHPAGWTPPDSYAFAQSVVREGRPWLRQTRLIVAGGRARVEFASTKPLERAVLLWTAGSGFTGKREWREAPAAVNFADDVWAVEVGLPREATGWFINVHSGPLLGSSDYQEGAPPPE